MNHAAWILVTQCLIGVDPEATTNAKWKEMFDGIAANYELVTKPEQQKLDLVERAVYTWARSGPHGGTYGAVYVWTNRGNVESVACFWRNPGSNGSVSVVHELHSLSPVVLDSLGRSSDSWKPKAGVERRLLVGAPVPASSSVARMQQMRAICRDFSAHSISLGGDRTELRLLPQPLCRYQSTNPDIVDGGLFAFVCSVGTDPEAFLQLEVIKTEDGPRWHYTLARFSHMNLFAHYQDKEIWHALRDEDNPISRNADRTYWVFHQKVEHGVLQE